MARFFRTYRMEGDRRIDGVFVMAFIHNGNYFLTPIFIYQDGMIDCWGRVGFEEFTQKVQSGWVVTQPPEGAEISVSFLASFTATDVRFWIKPREFIKEVADEIEALNGRPTTSDFCRQAYEAYRDGPTAERLQALQVRYAAIPEHNRPYILGDMDYKDSPLRALLNARSEEKRRNALRLLKEVWDG